MDTESTPVKDESGKNDLADDRSAQTPLQRGTGSEKYLYALFVLAFLLVFALGGYFFIKNTSFLKQVDPNSLISNNCSYNGKTYKPNESFKSSDGCNSCSCGRDGQISCTAMACDSSVLLEPTAVVSETSNVPITAIPTPASFTTYTDGEFGYKVTYDPDSWMFRHTYGKGGISNSDTSGTPKIISGFDLHKPSNLNASAVIVLNVMDANGDTDIDQWIKNYELNVPKNSSSQLIISPNIRVREYTYKYDLSDRFTRRSRYFINNDKVFRINYSELNEFSPETTQIVETFKP